ncbi:RING finger protein 24 [Symbiodinium microadriaticum]|uniref:RING finger protein 24 n=1 Tax=Symbiodinium microadriaticum TaxID=2951 RepID=A0A1Q9DY08_SYMMI|nr:RING finger protein 24 [Symbiodinium microadriaticum]
MSSADLGGLELPRVRLQILGASIFCWSCTCVVSLVVYMTFPDKAALPNMLLAMAVGSITMVAAIHVLLSDRWQRPSEHVQEHIWASIQVGGLMQEGVQPKFHRIQTRTSQSAKGAQSVTTVLEEVDVLWQSPGVQQTCVCCLEDFRPEDQVSLLPCGHLFHQSCLADWHSLKRSAHACPICRDSWANV